LSHTRMDNLNNNDNNNNNNNQLRRFKSGPRNQHF